MTGKDEEALKRELFEEYQSLVSHIKEAKEHASNCEEIMDKLEGVSDVDFDTPELGTDTSQFRVTEELE